MTWAKRIEDLLCSQTPQILGAYVRRYGYIDLAEDAVQGSPAHGCSDRDRRRTSTILEAPHRAEAIFRPVAGGRW